VKTYRKQKRNLAKNFKAQQRWSSNKHHINLHPRSTDVFGNETSGEEKGKGKVILCLTKYNAMKTYGEMEI
jgi:hypothetical protein